MIGTDDRHLPHFHSLHLLPLRSPRRFGDVGFMTSIHVMVYDSFNPSQVALIKIKPYLVDRNTMVARQRQNCPAHIRERLRQSSLGMLNIAVIIPFIL